MALGRKQIAFDLDTKKLEKYYPSEHWKNAYRDIKTFMQKNSFDWQQGSVYVSTRAYNPQQINALMCKMVDVFPWLNVCMRDCAVTNVGRSHKLNFLFDKTANIPENSFEKDTTFSLLKEVVKKHQFQNENTFSEEIDSEIDIEK